MSELNGGMSTGGWCDHVCPECKAGKHRNCDGTAWCIFRDEPTECSCVECELRGGAA